MNSKYNQSWKQIRDALAQKTAARRRRQTVVKAVSGLLSAAIAGMVLFSLVGCATAPIAVKGSLEELGDHATASGLIQIAQMGRDCTSQDKALKRILRDIMTDQKVPAPQKVLVTPLAGSSFCGFSQGTANETGTLELGARNTARAQVKMYWSDITFSQLQKAQAILDAMRPIPAAAAKTAHTPQ